MSASKNWTMTMFELLGVIEDGMPGRNGQRKPGRPRLTGQPSSRTGENPPYGMIGGIEETSASFEARSAPRSYPTAGVVLPARTCTIRQDCPSGRASAPERRTCMLNIEWLRKP